MSCRTSCRNLSLILALLALAIMAAPAFATGNCIGDVSRANSCTAGDVRIAAVDSTTVNVFQGGIPHTNQCIEHGTFSFTADFEVKTTSNSARSNIGVFFGTKQANAFSGTCSDAILTPRYPCAFVNGVSTAMCGDVDYEELDQSINNEQPPTACGDTSSTDNFANAFGPSTQRATLEVDNVSCPASGSTCPAASGLTGSCLVLPVCSSWYQPANGMPVCDSPTHAWVAAAIPGTPSKCTCGVLYVPVIPVTVAPIVQKACTTANTPGAPGATFTFNPNTASPTTCDAGAEGSTVTYTVAIHSTATLANNNTVVDQVCDSVYGKIYSDFTTPTCPAGAAGFDGKATNISCPPGGTAGIAPGATATCAFTAPQGEIATVTDTVSASGHSSLDASATFTNTQSVDSVTVTSTDAAASAAVTKGVDTLVHGCATVRYTVDVKNTSGADESESLSAFNDTSFGNITEWTGSTPANANVLGTTCGVAAGVGTLSGSSGAGILPASLAPGTGTPPTGGGDYACKFDAQICGDIATINLPTPPGGTCLGFQHVNKVTATITDDNSEGNNVSQTANTLTEDVCFTHFESSAP